MTKEEHLPLVERLNQKLIDMYGWFTEGVPNYRISWSEDQFELRQGIVNKFDIHGNRIGEITGLQLLPKYRQWLPNMWVLERCCDTLNELENKELTTKYSFEPLYPFRDHFNNALPPEWDRCWLMVAAVNAHLGKEVTIYKDPDLEPGAQRMKIEKLMEELFGNETNVGDALAYKQGVTVPGRIN